LRRLNPEWGRVERKGGVFTGETDESVFAFPVAIHESGNKLGQLLTMLGFGDEVVPGVTHIVAAAQGAGGEAAEDKDQDIIYEDVYFIPLVGGLLLHLD
jgi:hypothetical protein